MCRPDDFPPYDLVHDALSFDERGCHHPSHRRPQCERVAKFIQDSGVIFDHPEHQWHSGTWQGEANDASAATQQAVRAVIAAQPDVFMFEWLNRGVYVTVKGDSKFPPIYTVEYEWRNRPLVLKEG